MVNLVAQLHEAIQELRSLRPHYPFQTGEAEAQARVIYVLRRLVLSLPNPRIKGEDRVEFIEEQIGGVPTDEHVALADKSQRDFKLSPAQYLELERHQNGRCALCGTLLVAAARPHVDHIIPVAFGGKDDVLNVQLLCSNCNLGKAGALHWLMFVPFFSEGRGNKPSSRLRYTALQRYQGRCSVDSCTETSSSSLMHVVPHVAVQDGGRIIFDNLEVVCDSHFIDRIAALQRKAKLASSSVRRFGFG